MIFKNSVIIGIFTILSVLLGVVRDRLLSDIVGVGGTLDIYNAAFRVPDLALGVLFAFVSSATVIPFIAKAVNSHDKTEVQERMSSLFFFFGGLMTLISVAVVVLLPYFAKYIVPGFSPEATTEYIVQTRILMLQPILLGLSTLLSTYFQAKQRFYVYGVAPLLYTGAIIISILFFPSFGLQALIFGVVLGAAAHFSLQALFLIKDGIHVRPRFFKKSFVREQLAISFPRSGSVILAQVRALFFASFATTLGVGVLSAYLFALKVSDAILLLIPQTLATASIAHLSKASQEGDHHIFKSTVQKLLKVVVAISIVITIVTISASGLIVKILYGNSGAND